MRLELVTGDLWPTDGTQVKRFVIERIEDKEKFLAQIISDSHRVLDEAVLAPKEVFPWLLDRIDY